MGSRVRVDRRTCFVSIRLVDHHLVFTTSVDYLSCRIIDVDLKSPIIVFIICNVDICTQVLGMSFVAT